MYSDTITLFNRYVQNGKIVWLPTILRNVDLNIDKAAIIAKYGGSAGDNAILHIKSTPKNGEVTVGAKRYLPPKKWKAQDVQSAKTSITFTTGSKGFDFFVLGEWTGATSINDDDYLNGFYDYVNSEYDFCFTLTSVALYSAIPHFEILAK